MAVRDLDALLFWMRPCVDLMNHVFRCAFDLKVLYPGCAFALIRLVFELELATWVRLCSNGSASESFAICVAPMLYSRDAPLLRGGFVSFRRLC